MLSDAMIKPIEVALEELKKAYETKDISLIDPALTKINDAWKDASQEMYKAQSESANKADDKTKKEDKGSKKSGSDDDVQDVDFEEVKD